MLSGRQTHDDDPTPFHALASLKGRVLLVDDEEDVARALGRTLVRGGYDVVRATSGQEASQSLAESAFDVVMSDISMPGMSGLELLGLVRQNDVDVPVILMTGNPTIDSATRAIQLGVAGYLIKPVAFPEMVATVERAVQIHRLARIRREALQYLTSTGDWIGDRAGLEASFASALESLWMAYQPIVSWTGKTTIAFEALVRPIHAVLSNPGLLIGAAERLGHLHLLGRRLRDMVAGCVRDAPEVPEVFVNIHGYDLNDDLLLSPAAPLSQIAERVVLEITERASVEGVKDLGGRLQRLRALGFRIAVDDLGSGYAGLTSFAQLHPDIVKIDMSLVRDVDKEPTKERLVRSLSELCREMKILVVCEGVETAAERDTLVALGCDLFQGYYFARPGKPFPSAVF
jgi:EAL domain-containing protein (putative c-di-GMP-specific phosphodiesterase class I)